MQRGQFLELFFSERGDFTPKPNGEVDVKCPFPHSKGYETRPSAHVNINKHVFHCKVCQAEGRFEDGGLSEVGFIAEWYGVKFEEALKILRQFQKTDVNEEVWKEAVKYLATNTELMNYLRKERGLTDETITEYQLGYVGDGIIYPVFVNGMLLDKRTYNINWRKEQDAAPDKKIPKIKSETGASGLLFPYDHWLDDDRPTVLVAGENDCLLTRQHGFNALTKTNGEGGAFPKIFLSQFKNKTVYICYDCDEAGKHAALTDAYVLREAGATVFILDLGLPGTKDNKDLSDFFLKNGGSSSQLLEHMHNAREYTEKEFTETKNQHYPLVNLWDVPEGKYYGRYVSSRVILSGKYDMPMQAPTAVEWRCKPQKEHPACMFCKHNENPAGWWMLEDSLSDLLELVDVKSPQQDKAIRKFIGFPTECPDGDYVVRARQAVYKVIFTPDVETEDILSGHRSVEQYAYTVGLNLEDGNRYRAYFSSYAHPLDGQRVYMIVDRVEESDNAVNAFRMTPAIQEELKAFQGNPFEVMADKAKRMHDLPGMTFPPQAMIANAVNVIYHSVLRFRFNEQEMKGYPELLVVGESRTGKSETALFFQRYVQLGNFMALKGATTAGLLGGADKMNNGGFKISWGTIPRNNRGLVVMDELSGMDRSVMASLTAMRSERVATVHKIAKGKAPAETRLLWISNPRVGANGQSRHIKDFSNGVEIILDLIGSDEDVARFDACMVVVRDKDSSPLDKPEKEAHTAGTYRHLLHWVWSRTADQIKFAEGVEAYIVHVAAELNEKYDTNVKFFGAEAWKKVARIAVACAANCFSCDDSGNVIVVEKPHVDWAARFLANCYDNPVFRLPDYVRKIKSVSETNEAVNTVVASLCRTQPMVIKSLLDATDPVPMFNLQAVSGLENKQDFTKLINRMASAFLINVNASGVQATRRLRLAVDIFRESRNKDRMVPLTEEGGSTV